MGNLAHYFEEQGIAKGKAEGKAEGIAKGKAEGKAEAKKETAKAMLQKGADIHFISEVTNLTIQEINKLKGTQSNH